MPCGGYGGASSRLYTAGALGLSSRRQLGYIPYVHSVARSLRATGERQFEAALSGALGLTLPFFDSGTAAEQTEQEKEEYTPKASPGVPFRFPTAEETKRFVESVTEAKRSGGGTGLSTLSKVGIVGSVGVAVGLGLVALFGKGGR